MATGFFVGVVLRGVLVGVPLFAFGAILFAIRGYLNTGDKAVAGALIVVALVAIGIEAIGYRGYRLLLGTIAAAPRVSRELAVGSSSPYPMLVGAWLRRRRDRPRLRLAWSLGAFVQEGDISPLYVFFEVVNAGQSDVELDRLFVAPRGDRQPVYEGPFEGERDLPRTLRRGEAVRFWVRTKTLARALKEAGHDGRPGVKLVAEDGLGNHHEEGFRFRVDEYLRLKDE